MGACGHRRGVDDRSKAANARRERRAIAIATALDKYRGGRRGFLPRGLCNTCPTAVQVFDRLRAWAGVTQALTGAVSRSLATTVGSRSRSGLEELNCPGHGQFKLWVEDLRVKYCEIVFIRRRATSKRVARLRRLKVLRLGVIVTALERSLFLGAGNGSENDLHCIGE